MRGQGGPLGALTTGLMRVPFLRPDRRVQKTGSSSFCCPKYRVALTPEDRAGLSYGERLYSPPSTSPSSQVQD